MHKAAVVILNWNGTYWLSRFLHNVVEYSSPYPVYVIDNNSDDGSIAYLALKHPEVKVIALDRNYGFAEGYNKGLEKVHAEVYILLNSDVEVSANWIDPVLALFSQLPNVAAVQPRILDYNKPQYFEYAGAAGGMLDKHGVPFCRGRIFEDIEQDLNQYGVPAPIFWASGAALFIKAERFWEVHGFDASFFAHMEEIDLCWRLQNKGYEIFYCPDSKVYHVGGGTLNKAQPRKYYLNFRNSLKMLLKNLPSSKVLPIIFTRLCLDGLAALKMAITGQPVMLWIVLKAHFAFYGSFFKILAQRSALESQQLPASMFQKSIILQYYYKKIRKYSELPR